MYLVCKAIHEHSDIRVLLTGEISDELFGYKYTDFAPSPEEFQRESEKRVRSCTCTTSSGRTGASPSTAWRPGCLRRLDFVRYVMSVDPAKKMNVYGKGKYLLRHAFEAATCPRAFSSGRKAAFSDAVGHSMVDD